jgi:hypothetical protein
MVYVLQLRDEQWHMLSQGYPNYKTVHRRSQRWCREEVLRKVLTDLANALRGEGEIDESKRFIDAASASGKGGGEEIGSTRGARQENHGHGLPLSDGDRAYHSDQTDARPVSCVCDWSDAA